MKYFNGVECLIGNRGLGDFDAHISAEDIKMLRALFGRTN
jgi:hypothetical protein